MSYLKRTSSIISGNATNTPKVSKHTNIPQTMPIPNKNMVLNNAGGYVFQTSDLETLKRFLILGTEGGTYYCTEKKLTKDSLKNMDKIIQNRGRQVVDLVVEVSTKGLAIKNTQCELVLAACASSSDVDTRNYALSKLTDVCRIPTHLFHFIEFAEQYRGWGRSLKRAVANWYNSKDLNSLIFHTCKYQSRDGWSNKDLLKLSHANPGEDMSRSSVYKYITSNVLPQEYDSNLEYIYAVEELNKSISESRVLELMDRYNLPMEVIPTDKRTDKVYEKMVSNGGLTWLIRNLGNLSSRNVGSVDDIVQRLTDVNSLRKARIHPMSILLAQYQYTQGHGLRGSNSWSVKPRITVALDEAFKLCFGNVVPTNKRYMLALDVSGSMTMGTIGGLPNITPRVASAAMALVTLNTEPNTIIKRFSSGIMDLEIKKDWSLSEVISYMNRLIFSSTDCSLPMIHATDNKLNIDGFIVYTDNETYAGRTHPSIALKNYRNMSGIDSKLIVCGMTATNFTIADPKDKGMLDVVGASPDLPQLISQFMTM